MGSKPRGISASRCAAVLGLSQFQTRVDVWIQICEDRNPGFCIANGIEPPKPVDNAPVRWGLAFEDAIVKLAEIERGEEIHSREKFVELAGVDAQLSAHLDGIYSSGEIHEGKSTSAFAFRDAWGEPGTDRIPRGYQIQVAHQQLVSSIDRAVVSVLIFPTRVDEFEEAGITIAEAAGGPVLVGKDGLVFDSPLGWARVLRQMQFFKQYIIERNEELGKMILDACRAFWSDHVLTEIPPNPETYSDILRLMPEPRGTVVADEQQERWASEYNQIGKEAAQSKKQQDKLKALLLGGIERGAEHPIDNDSVEALVLRSRDGRKIASLSKGKEGRITFRCGG